MPTQEHEMLIDLFHNRPTLAAVLLEDLLDVEVPEYEHARLDSNALTDCKPTEYRADAVVVLQKDGEPAMAVVVEVQRSPNDDKRWSWPVYLTTLRARLRCPTVLLVVCPDNGTAKWCAEPFDLDHPGMTMAPLVIGPDAVPAITDPAQAIRTPEPAVLSALSHRRDIRVVDALNTGLGHIKDVEIAQLYSDYVLAALPEAARKHMEDLMATGTYEFQSDYAKRLKAESKADAIVRFLTARGIPVPDETRRRIFGCTDLDQLKQWVDRAATVDTADELFD